MVSKKEALPQNRPHWGAEHYSGSDSTGGPGAEVREPAEPRHSEAWLSGGRAQDGPPEAQVVVGEVFQHWDSTPGRPRGSWEGLAWLIPVPIPL